MAFAFTKELDKVAHDGIPAARKTIAAR